jgi:hypothetical protein
MQNIKTNATNNISPTLRKIIVGPLKGKQIKAKKLRLEKKHL